jgi:hypothetical protein
MCDMKIPSGKHTSLEAREMEEKVSEETWGNKQSPKREGSLDNQRRDVDRGIAEVEELRRRRAKCLQRQRTIS